MNIVATASELSGALRTRIICPLILATLFAVALAIGGLLMVTRFGDAVSIERQTREAKLAVSASIDELARTQQIAAVWDTLALELRKSHPDWKWIDDNVGIWLFNMFGHDQVYLLDAKDQPIYATIDGRRVDDSAFASIAGTVDHFVEAVRGRIVDHNNGHERLPNNPLHPESTVRTSPGTVHATDLAWIHERPAAVSVMRIAPHTSAVSPTPGKEPLLISVRFLDGSILQDLARHNLLAGARVSPSMDTRQGEASFALKSHHGSLGYFHWRPELPGSRLRSRLAAILVGLTLLMCTIMAMLARSLYSAMRDQHQSKLELEAAVLELQASEAQAHHLAFHDVLTGMPNRALFQERIEQALAHVRNDRRIALLMLDMDRFKQVNDTLGHAAGDGLIRDFAARLSTLLDSHATLARLGGDEFIILVPDVACNEQIHQLCEQILAIVRTPFEVVGNHAFVGVSIGAVFAPDAGIDRMELLRKADIALYQAKAEGRGCFRIFSPEMDDSVRFRSEIEDELRTALNLGTQLHVFYQPQVSAAGQAIVGLEALIRWQHPTRGMIPPETFIQIAEEAGLMPQLGEWVLQQACIAAKRWPDLYIGVNLSPVQFRTPGFASRLMHVVREAGVRPRQIELEVTETVLLQDDALVANALTQLRDAGFRIALDDFGTGYSSLSYLHRFEVDKIKIDKTFIQNVGKLDSTAIVTAVVNLGRAMGLEVTAEGVETVDQRNFLASAGCNVLQGHFYSRALPEAEVQDFVKDQARKCAA